MYLHKAEKKNAVNRHFYDLDILSLKHRLQADSSSGSRLAPVCTYVLLVMLTLGGH